MKTALCLSGQSRTFSKCFESQYNNIIKPLHADVFIHTWAYAGNPHVHSTHNGSYDVTKYKNSVDSYEYSTPLTDINNLYKPKIMLVEYPDYNFFINKMKESKHFPNLDEKNTWFKLFKSDNKYKWFNLLMMHYGTYKSNELKKNFEDKRNFKYDLVIRSRFDLYFEKAIIKKVKKNVVYLPPNEDIDITFTEDMKKALDKHGPSFMTNDKFAYGDSEAMDYYSSIYKFYDKNVDHYIHHGEASVAEHLWHKNKSKYKEIKVNKNIKMKIQR